MVTVFKSGLDTVEIERIKLFCDSAEYCSLEQSLGFPGILNKSKINYFYLLENDLIKSFAQINESFKFAHIWFGPVCGDKDLMLVSINEIISHYKQKGFFYLGIQMYYKSGYDTEYIEYELNKLHKIRYIFNNANTKSSLEICLDGSMAEINGNLRKGHKSDIKKALKAGVTVEETTASVELGSFFDVYSKMCKVRGIPGHTKKEMTGICDYLILNQKGQILVAKDNSDVILGGAIFAYQGISVRYLLGASDPDRRDLPVLHPVIYKAIEMAKNNNFKYFDFWGYNHFADEGDQANYINHFKKGFGGYYTFFAKKMNINLVTNGFALYRSSIIAKEFMAKLKKD
jgi:lipid II:glycine glycyltransferase (peptidoglycan interpeptide bridge formation enzyme)